MKHMHIAISLALLFSTLATNAGQIIRDSDSDLIWKAGVDGVEIEWAPSGGFKRIYSAHYQPVNIPDRRGISKAQIIAEEKAKAAIVRFMDQQVSSSRLVTQIDSDIEAATVSRDANGESWTKENRRKMVEDVTEVTGSYAAGRLRGVITLEKGYDEAKSEAWVKVGISQKTMAAAQDLDDAISAAPMAAKAGKKSEAGGTAAMRQPSEVRRSAQKDW